jgi:hypothetical protein
MHLAWASGVWQWWWSLYKFCILGNRNRSTAIHHLYTYTAPQPTAAATGPIATHCLYPMCLCVVGAQSRRTKKTSPTTRCPSDFLVVICPYLGPSASPTSVAASLDQDPIWAACLRPVVGRRRQTVWQNPGPDPLQHRKDSALSSSPLSAFGDLSYETVVINDPAFCRAKGNSFPGAVRVLSGAAVRPSRAVGAIAISSPPFLPPRLVRGRSSPPRLAP